MRDEIAQAIQRVCDSGQFLHGPDCRQLEESVAALCKVDHAVSCASGSDALLLALMALKVGPGDEVIVPSFTFFATASVVWRLGANPVFADIDPHTFNLDPEDVERSLSPATKAIIPVHLFGQCADMQRICELARDHQVDVIEDAAQAIGARFRARPAGSWGKISCFSFYPTKNLGGFGDGGMLVTQSPEAAERLRLLAAHGMKPRYHHSEVGINSRLDSVQAAVLNIKITHLQESTRQRQRNAAIYQQLFEAAGLDHVLIVPVAGEGQHHVWNQFTIRVPGQRRDDLRSHLMDHGIGSEIYYPVPLHRQRCFRALPGKRPLPATEAAANEVLSLPIFPELTEAEQQAVVGRIHEFFVREKMVAA